MIQTKPITLALYFGNRGFFPAEVLESARAEMTRAVEEAGCRPLLMDASLTRYGGVETVDEGLKYAAFLKEHEGEYDGVVLCLPNFGDENGALAAMRDAGVPILLQAYPDEIGKMDFDHRRDAFCGKFSIMDVFCQYGIPFTAFAPHVAHPNSPEFAQNLRDFAGVCRVVRGMKRFSIGAIGARTTAFKTVRYDELALQKAGITVDAFDLSDLFARMKKMAEDRPELVAKREFFREYSNFTDVPAHKLDQLARTTVAIEDMVAQYHLDTVALRCWPEFQTEVGIAPCIVLGALNECGIPAACEMDVANAPAMYALSLASGEPAACLDWNNNYGNDPDKCILFHCGPVPRSLMSPGGFVGNHKMHTKTGAPDCGWGTDEGRIAPMDFTFCSGRTDNGKFYTYTGNGVFTDECIEDGFFGCGGVAKIEGLQDKLIYIGKNGFRHHVCVTRGNVQRILDEAFNTYLHYDNKSF
ncbi:MAG: hypothetical protein IKD06_05200 [Clostridia bacterium]|nr:hypothetical protein [Clostridia bacterium]